MQKGCIKGSQGCKEQLTIDSVVMQQAMKNCRNIYTTYVDYQKAFDSVPHSWLKEVLTIYKVCPEIRIFLDTIMNDWRTTVQLRTQDQILKTNPINICCGIFQGDTLSPLWFCLALNPLSAMLIDSGYGFKINTNNNTTYRLSHLLYMDDIKMYAGTETHMKGLIQLLETFTTDTRMKFGLNKCKTQRIIKGKYYLEGFQLEDGNSFEAMGEDDTYKYLGCEQSRKIEDTVIRERLKKEFFCRLEKLCKSGLNSKNLFKAINTFAIPVISYSFGIVKWTPTALDTINTKIRTTLTKHRMHHPKSAIERITLLKQLDLLLLSLNTKYHRRTRLFNFSTNPME
jgi:hypothetical protein